MNKAALLQLQQERAKAKQALEMRYKKEQVYDNIGYEDNEAKQGQDSATSEYTCNTSKNEVEEEEEQSAHFWGRTNC